MQKSFRKSLSLFVFCAPALFAGSLNSELVTLKQTVNKGLSTKIFPVHIGFRVDQRNKMQRMISTPGSEWSKGFLVQLCITEQVTEAGDALGFTIIPKRSFIRHFENGGYKGDAVALRDAKYLLDAGSLGIVTNIEVGGSANSLCADSDGKSVVDGKTTTDDKTIYDGKDSKDNKVIVTVPTTPGSFTTPTWPMIPTFTVPVSN